MCNMKEEQEKHFAEFNQLSNDMFWNWYHSVYSNGYKDHHFEKLQWTGYNDKYWWDHAPKEESQTVRTCKCGKKFVINFDTNEVKELEAKDDLKMHS